MLTRRALTALATEPGTWLVLALCGAAPWLFIDWFQPGLLIAAAAIGLSVLLALLWPVLKLRDPAFIERLLPAPGELGAAGEVRVRKLEADLARLGAEQGVEQLRLMRQKLDRLVEVLRHRLDEGEVTYGRYLGTAEQVYLAGLDNLHEVVVTLTSLSGMDEAYLDRRVEDIERDGITDKERLELETIRQSRGVLEGQRAKVEDLLAENERAMAVLDNTSAALAGTRMRGGHASLSADEAIGELEALAARTGRYASGK
ncbi:MAG: hypothetical protein KDG55_07220 [Rhodocyclaceae bacterium]|nr:hypothetical protein [Rhodocyclaceae bacterium]